MAAPQASGLFSLVERNWGGMNSNSARQGLEPGEFQWLENLIPLAPADLAVIPDKNSIASVSVETINAFDTVTIAGTSYIVAATSAGNVYAWHTDGTSKTTVTTGAGASGVTFSAWQNQYLMVLTAAGALGHWDGSTFTAGSSLPWLGSTQCVASWGGRLWVAAGLTVFYSAPNSVTDWTAADGGGSFIVSDEYFEGNVIALVASQNYLYVLGQGGVLVLANLQLLAGNITYFQVTRASQVSGITGISGATPFMNSLILVNGHGVEAFSGITPRKLSSKMDVFFSNVDYTKTISTAVGTVYNQLCFLALVFYKPNSAWYIVCISASGKVFLANMGTQALLTWVTLNGAAQAFATDGTNIYSLFVNTTNNLAFKAVTAFTDAGDPTQFKQLMKFAVEVRVPSSAGASLAFTPDTETGSDASQAYTLANGYNWCRTTTSQFGQYLGTTITGAIAGGIIMGYMAQFKKSAPWP